MSAMQLAISSLTYADVSVIAADTSLTLSISTISSVSIDFSTNKAPFCTVGTVAIQPNNPPSNLNYQITAAAGLINNAAFTFPGTCSDGVINYKAKISKIRGLDIEQDLPSWVTFNNVTRQISIQTNDFANYVAFTNFEIKVWGYVVADPNVNSFVNHTVTLTVDCSGISSLSFTGVTKAGTKTFLSNSGSYEINFPPFASDYPSCFIYQYVFDLDGLSAPPTGISYDYITDKDKIFLDTSTYLTPTVLKIKLKIIEVNSNL